MPFSKFQYDEAAVPGLEAIYRWAYRRGGKRGLNEVVQALRDHIRMVQENWDPESLEGSETGSAAGTGHEYLTPFAGGLFMLAFAVAEEDPEVLVLGMVKEMPHT
jgi:hypothetical protein